MQMKVIKNSNSNCGLRCYHLLRIWLRVPYLLGGILLTTLRGRWDCLFYNKETEAGGGKVRTQCHIARRPQGWHLNTEPGPCLVLRLE